MLSWECDLSREVVVTPSIVASIPDILKRTLIENISEEKKLRHKNILVSSNSLANRFIFERWKIRSSQRRYYKNLFSDIRNHCRRVFRYYERKGVIKSQLETNLQRFSVHRFDEIRGNIILGFLPIDNDQPIIEEILFKNMSKRKDEKG